MGLLWKLWVAFSTCYIVWIMCCSWIYSPWAWKSIQMICTHVLDYVDFGFLWCPWVFTIWLIHSKNLRDTWENHVGILLQWRNRPSWCIVVMKNLCVVKVLGVGNYWSWKIIWNSSPTLGVNYVCLIYRLNCDMQMSGHCSIHVCLH
jgi:hypothetical protein